MTAMAQSWIDYYMGWINKLRGPTAPNLTRRPALGPIDIQGFRRGLGL